MQKKSLILVFFLFLFGINFVTASFHYGGYSLSDILNTFDSSTVILTSIFLIAFILIFWPLSKFFRENALLAGIISFAMSFLLIFEINRRGYNFTGFFYNIGISEGILYTIAPIILLVGFFLISYSKDEKKFRFHKGFLILGGLIIAISFTDIIYAKGITFILGAILLGIGIWLWRRRRKRHFVDPYYQNYDTYSGSSQRQIYKQELAERRYNEKVRQAQIRARTKNIQEIRGVREKRDIARNQRREAQEAQKIQAREAEVRRRAGNIANIRKSREKELRRQQKRQE